MCVRKPEGSVAVFAYGSFLLDLCLSMICLHLFLQCVSVGDTAGKLYGERQPAGMCSSRACNCLYYSFIYVNLKDCSAPQSLFVHFTTNSSLVKKKTKNWLNPRSLCDRCLLFFYLMSVPFGKDVRPHSA